MKRIGGAQMFDMKKIGVVLCNVVMVLCCMVKYIKKSFISVKTSFAMYGLERKHPKKKKRNAFQLSSDVSEPM